MQPKLVTWADEKLKWRVNSGEKVSGLNFESFLSEELLVPYA